MSRSTQSTQFICTAHPFCACVGHATDWDECTCTAARLVAVSPAGDTTVCRACGASMVRIDFATGEPVSCAEFA